MKIRSLSKVLTVMLLGVVLLLSGCGLDGDNKEGGISIGGGSSASGTGGVELSFAEKNPSSEMLVGEAQTFAFVFKNNQNHPVNDLVVKAKGFDYSYVSGLDNYKDSGSVDEIPRATIQSGAGIYDGLKVDVTVDGFGDREYNFNPTFDYCYTAKTTFSEEVCVPSKDNICDEKITKSKEQNGPLTVNVERITPTGDQIRIDFKLSDSGKGQIVNECFDVEDHSNAYNGLEVKLGTNVGTCEAPSGEKIINGESFFNCKFARGSDDSYTSQVQVSFDYKYQQSIKKSIVVRDLDKN